MTFGLGCEENGCRCRRWAEERVPDGVREFRRRLKWRPDIRLTLFNAQCHWENKNAVVLNSRWVAHHQKSCTTPQMASVCLRLVKDTSAEAGETSLWMNQSACWSAQHLLDPAGTRRVLEKGTRCVGSCFSSASVWWRSPYVKILQNQKTLRKL